MRNAPRNGGAQAPPTSGQLAAEMFIAEATDIRDLLSHYEASTAQLKEELGGFVHREIDEQAKFAHLRATVNQAELSSLRDTRFLEYLARREAAEKEAARRKPASSAASSDADELRASPYWWQCMWNSDSSALADWAPDAALSLTTFKSLSEMWLGWRQDNAAAQADLDSAVAAVCAQSDEKSEYCCFANGALVARHIEADGVALRRLETVVPQMIGAASGPAGGDGDRVAVALDGYASAVALAVATTCSRLLEAMGLSAADATNSNERSRLPLTGDGWDTLVFVQPQRLQHTVVLRGFFFRGQLALVEQIGAEVDMTPLFFCDDANVADREARHQRVHRLLEQTLATLHDSMRQAGGGAGQSSQTLLPTNVALTVAIRIPRSCNATVGGVLLDIHPLTPQLPFDGQVSWMDVCAVGRQRAGSAASSGAVTGGGNESTDVLFRLTHLPVAALQPYDPLSRRLFPLLNAQLLRRPSLRQDTSDAPQDGCKPAPASRHTGSSAWPSNAAAVLCVGTVACVVVAVYGAARWRRSA